jgi:hypothetical protein
LAFISSADALQAAKILRRRDESREDVRILLESPVLYESVRPFLESLKNTKPVHLPMASYIKHGDLGKVNLPEYSTNPDHLWNLKTLLNVDAPIDALDLDPRSEFSIEAARSTLHEHGKLDPR